MTGTTDLDAFLRLLTALTPWLDKLVIVGGWAHRLYRLHPHALPVNYAPLLTLDADVAVPADLATGAEDIRQRLLAHGFQEELLGDDRPPVTHYRLGDEASAFYAEFLAPLVGSGYDRRKHRRVTARIGGITSQRLRHVDVLLAAPLSIEFEGKTLRIANPVAFVAQKILIYSRRAREKRAKDVLYVHDTLEVFGGRLEALGAEWDSRIAPRLHRNHVRTVQQASDQIFGRITDAIRGAAVIAAARGLTPESVRETCRLGLQRLFG